MLIFTGLSVTIGGPITITFYVAGLFPIALVLGLIIYGFFLAWRGVVRSTRKEEFRQPQESVQRTKPETEIDARSVRGGHYVMLRILVVIAIISAGVSYSGSYFLYFISPAEYYSFGQWLFIPALLVGMASAEVVWEDAKAINRGLMENTIAAGWWSFFALFLAFIAVPLYTFDRRKSALSGRS